jgi:regulator of sigma E protease
VIVSAILFISVLCVMVVIHEFGHFIVAKILGIPAEVFSVGFGPRLFGFQWDGTDFRLSAIPLGGYVRFKGENMEALQGASDAAPDEFLAHPGWKRLLVALAGPVFNIATALLVPAAAILIGYQDDIMNAQQVVLGDVRSGTPAEKAGLLKGDRIVSYNQKANPTWQDLMDETMVRLDEPIPLSVERNGQKLDLSITPRIDQFGNEKYGRVDLEPPVNYLRVDNVKSGTPADKAGMRVGDKITAINHTPIYSSTQLMRTTQEAKEMLFAIDRNGQPLEVRATPLKDEAAGLYRVGVVFSAPQHRVLIKTTSLAQALRFGWEYNQRILRMSGVIFKQMFAGKRSVRDVLGGPVRIAKETSNAYENGGLADVVRLMGLLSLNLGIFNLLPIPVLDGGMILLIIVEWIMGLVGLSLTMNMRERFQQVGLVLVMLLMGFVMINDFLPR